MIKIIVKMLLYDTTISL